jgi:hypothetical protein
MATGLLGASDLSTTSNVVLYTCPDNTFTVLTVNMVNRNSSEVRLRLAIAEADSPTDSEWVEYDVLIQGNGVLERTGLVLDAEKRIVVRTNATGVTATAYGIETRTVS